MSYTKVLFFVCSSMSIKLVANDVNKDKSFNINEPLYLLCIDCLSCVFFSSAPMALQTAKHSHRLFLELRRRDPVALLSLQSWTWLVCRHWLWQTLGPLYCLTVCTREFKSVLCVQGISFLIFLSSSVLRRPFLDWCVQTQQSHFAPAATHHTKRQRQRRGLGLSR